MAQERYIFYKQQTIKQGSINSIAFAPKSSKYACATDSETVCIYDLKDKNYELNFIGHRERVNSIVFAHHANYFATGSDDHSVRLWNLDCREAIAISTEHTQPV